MSPAYIRILLHCYYSPEEVPNWEAPVTQEAINDFLQHELIELSGNSRCYQTTEAGRVLVDALCAVPYPVKKWVMP